MRLMAQVQVETMLQILMLIKIENLSYTPEYSEKNMARAYKSNKVMWIA